MDITRRHLLAALATGSIITITIGSKTVRIRPEDISYNYGGNPVIEKKEIEDTVVPSDPDMPYGLYTPYTLIRNCPKGTTLRFSSDTEDQFCLEVQHPIGEPSDPEPPKEEPDPEPPKEEAFFEVNITSINTPIKAGQKIELTASIENTGDLEATKDITLSISGVGSKTVSKTLSGGSSTNTIFEITTTTEDAGNYEVTVETQDDTDSTSITIKEEPEPAFFEVSITGTNTPVEAEQPVIATINIKNTGDLQDTQELIVEIQEVSTGGKTITLEGGISKTIESTLSTTKNENGDYTLTASTSDTTDSKEITIENPPEEIKDYYGYIGYGEKGYGTPEY